MEGTPPTAADAHLLLCIDNQILLGPSSQAEFLSQISTGELGSRSMQTRLSFKTRASQERQGQGKRNRTERQGSRATGLTFGFLLLILQRYRQPALRSLHKQKSCS